MLIMSPSPSKLCYVSGCRTVGGWDEGVSYHRCVVTRYNALATRSLSSSLPSIGRFPSDHFLRAKWVSILGKAPKKQSKICSRHFEPGRIIRTAGRRSHLLPGSLPTRRLPPPRGTNPLFPRARRQWQEEHNYCYIEGYEYIIFRDYESCIRCQYIVIN